jgi:glycerol-3-phosphate acyltransferase PlsY
VFLELRMAAYIVYPLAALIGYLAGSIPFGLLMTRAAGLGDIRQIGSGNIGATNVLRTGRKDLALATLLLDSLKAGLVALGFGALGGPEMGLTAGAAAFVGHCYPIWLRFKGGKALRRSLACCRLSRCRHSTLLPPSGLSFLQSRAFLLLLR